MYVSDVMRKDSSIGNTKSPKFPTSSDLTSPYILACNYADGNPKLVSFNLTGVRFTSYLSNFTDFDGTERNSVDVKLRSNTTR